MYYVAPVAAMKSMQQVAIMPGYTLEELNELCAALNNGIIKEEGTLEFFTEFPLGVEYVIMKKEHRYT